MQKGLEAYIVLLVVLACWVGILVGNRNEPEVGTSESARSSDTPSPSPSPTQGAPENAASDSGTVTAVVDDAGFDIVVDLQNHGIQEIHIPYVRVPEYSTECGLDAALEFYRSKLEGETVTVTPERWPEYGPPDSPAITLPDGTDFAVALAQAGHVYRVDEDASSEVKTAFEDAKAREVGLWGSPCNGTLHPEWDTDNPDVSDNWGAHYDNCDEARAAGAAPLYAGEPGYRGDLDADGDGVACEWA